MKSVLVGILLCVVSTCVSSAESINLPIKSQSVLVLDADSNEVLYQRNSNEVRSIASITKLMTALVTVEAKLDPNEIIVITNEDVENTKLHNRVTSTSLRVGSAMTREELLRLTLMNSQNRAACALARTYPGGREAFINTMNLKATQLGMKHTTYVDPTGLFNSNVSTAEDLALLMMAANQHPEINLYSTTAKFTPSSTSHSFGTTNRLVTSKGWNILLQKTGYIKDAGRCVVMVTEVSLKRVIIVLLNTPSTQQRARDAVIIKYWLENNLVPSTSIVNQLSPYRSKRG
jgi:D-alanyl-D-alanine endopeptidase (penicillin-binding protein 7)